MNNEMFSAKCFTPTRLADGINQPYYYIFLIRGKAKFSIDLTEYKCKGNTLIFLSPFQCFKFIGQNSQAVTTLQFHGDFYCIEYHKKEVACNGVLFNNIYKLPFFSIHDNLFDEIKTYILKMQSICDILDEYNTSILRSYLQLILALSSKEKQKQMPFEITRSQNFLDIIHFQNILEKHFLKEKSVTFYANIFGLTVNSFNKKIKKNFKKPPSKLIHERIVLEAKKMLHLTNKPVKLIAAELYFKDQYYFSRYFKKEVGVSPKQFRDDVGISIVANQSI